MRFLYATCIFLCFGCFTLAKNIVLDDDLEQAIIECCDIDEVFITAEEGYQILITVETVDIPHDEQSVHYLLVKSGTSSDDGLDGIIFTHYITTPRQYLSLKNQVYIKFGEIGQAVTKNRKVEGETTTPDPRGEFLITVSRFGEGPTTVEITTTEIPWPTPSLDESANITVHISGKTPSWYVGNNVEKFREKVAGMAIEYCDINNINVTEDITTANVFIERIVQCPINWPNRKDCVQITFSLPIFQENEEEYQLSTENLEIMWSRYSDVHLKPEFRNYGTPETSVFTTWLIIICVTILLFSVVLYLFKSFGYKLSGVNKKKKTDDDDQDALRVKEPIRSDSLNPHPKQVIPEMFESENQLYDPDSPDNVR